MAFQRERGFNARLMARRPDLVRWLLLVSAAVATAPLAQTPASKTEPRTEIAVLVVAEDARSEVELVRLTRAIEESLVGGGRFDVTDWERALNPTAARERSARVQEATVAFGEGLRAYNDLDTVKALQWLERALESYQAAGVSQHWDPFVRAWVMKAACLVADGNQTAARRELSALLAVAPRAELSPQFFPREALLFAEKARAAPRGTTLQLESTPAGAELWVNGEPRGFAPATVRELPAGTHFVSASAPGFSRTHLRSRDGRVELRLAPAERGGELMQARAAIQKGSGKARDGAATTLGKTVGAAQVLLAVIRKSTTGDRLELELQRLDTSDGHNLAQGRGTVPLDAGLRPALRPMIDALSSRDSPRGAGGAPVSSGAGPSAWTSRHTGYTLLGAGAAVIGVASFFTAQAFATHREFQDTPLAAPRSAQLAQSGRTFALTADVTMIAGVLAAGAGAYLAFLAPGEREIATVPGDPSPRPPPPAPVKKTPSDDDDLKNH